MVVGGDDHSPHSLPSMAPSVLQSGGFILGLIGAAALVAATAASKWSVRDRPEDEDASLYQHQGLWQDCATTLAGSTRCGWLRDVRGSSGRGRMTTETRRELLSSWSFLLLLLLSYQRPRPRRCTQVAMIMEIQDSVNTIIRNGTNKRKGQVPRSLIRLEPWFSSAVWVGKLRQVPTLNLLKRILFFFVAKAPSGRCEPW